MSLRVRLAKRLSACSDCSVHHGIAETVFFLFKIGEALIEPSTRLYIYNSVCLEHFNSTYCTDLGRYPDRENIVQHLSGTYLLVYKLILNLPALFLGLFCGAWSDKIGRKIPAMLSALGTIVAVLFYMLSMIRDESTGQQMLYLVLVGASIRGGFGKSAVMTMAMHSYVTDISSPETRTARLGRLVSMNFFGCFVGSLLVGALLGVTGFDVIFCCVIGVNSMCMILVMMLLHESVPPIRSHSGILKGGEEVEGEEGEGELDGSTAGKQDAAAGGVFEDLEPVKRKMKIPFRLKHVRESVEVLIKPRRHRARFHILILFLVIFFQQTCKAGEVDISLLFVERHPLSWSRSMYGYLLATDYACLGLAAAVLLPILIRTLDLRDIFLIQIGFLFKVIRLLLMAFSSSSWMMYLSVVVGSPSALIVSCVKSLISKSVDEEEVGKVFSLLSCGETLSNLVGTIVFTSIYLNTSHFYAGFTFLIDAAAHFIVLICLFFLAYDMANSEHDGDDSDVGGKRLSVASLLTSHGKNKKEGDANDVTSSKYGSFLGVGQTLTEPSSVESSSQERDRHRGDDDEDKKMTIGKTEVGSAEVKSGATKDTDDAEQIRISIIVDSDSETDVNDKAMLVKNK